MKKFLKTVGGYVRRSSVNRLSIEERKNTKTKKPEYIVRAEYYEVARFDNEQQAKACLDDLALDFEED